MWFFSAVELTNKSTHVETDEQREDRLQPAHDRGNDNMVLLRAINTAQYIPAQIMQSVLTQAHQTHTPFIA